MKMRTIEMSSAQDDGKITAVAALCQFDILLGRVVATGDGYMTHAQKRSLDYALSERTRICQLLKLDPARSFG